jgi:hypothetical protein
MAILSPGSITTVFSIEKGSGKTTFVVNLGLHGTLCGETVLYFSPWPSDLRDGPTRTAQARRSESDHRPPVAKRPLRV